MTDKANLFKLVTTLASAALDPVGERVHSCTAWPVVNPRYFISIGYTGITFPDNLNITH